VEELLRLLSVQGIPGVDKPPFPRPHRRPGGR
jgi:hypothetical protein